MHAAKAINQTPLHQLVQPFSFLWQETAFAATQPAARIVVANAYVSVSRGHIHISDNSQVPLCTLLLTQILIQLSIKFCLVWELDRMLPVFTLRKIAIDEMQRLTIRQSMGCREQTSLSIRTIAAKSLADINGTIEAESRHAIMGFLSKLCRMVAELFDLGYRKIFILDFGLLQCDQVRLVFRNDSLQLMKACPDTVHIKGNDLEMIPFWGRLCRHSTPLLDKTSSSRHYP